MCVGVKATAADIKKGFKKAFAEPWPERLRYEVGESYPLIVQHTWLSLHFLFLILNMSKKLVLCNLLD